MQQQQTPIRDPMGGDEPAGGGGDDAGPHGQGDVDPFKVPFKQLNAIFTWALVWGLAFPIIGGIILLFAVALPASIIADALGMLGAVPHVGADALLGLDHLAGWHLYAASVATGAVAWRWGFQRAGTK